MPSFDDALGARILRELLDRTNATANLLVKLSLGVSPQRCG